MKRAVLIAAALAAPALAQNTCYTNANGTTLCSTVDGVINGNTNSVGNSVYRDRLGKRLEFSTDATGSARVVTPSGDVLRWQQPIHRQLQYGRTAQPKFSPPASAFPAPDPPSPWQPFQ